MKDNLKVLVMSGLSVLAGAVALVAWTRLTYHVFCLMVPVMSQLVPELQREGIAPAVTGIPGVAGVFRRNVQAGISYLVYLYGEELLYVNGVLLCGWSIMAMKSRGWHRMAILISLGICGLLGDEMLRRVAVGPLIGLLESSP